MMSYEPPPKIAYVVKRYPRFSETFIVNEILAHERAGWGISIFSLLPPVDGRFQPSITKVSAEVTYLPSKPKSQDVWSSVRNLLENYEDAGRVLAGAIHATPREICQTSALAEHMVAAGINHIHAHFATSSTEVARIASQMTGIPYSFTAHAKDIFHQDVCEEQLKKKIEEASSVVTVSDFNLAHLRSRFPNNSGKFTRIYNGQDLTELSFRAAETNKSKKIVAVGRLVEKKGFADLIGAFAILRETNSIGLTCDILGEGELREQLGKQISDLGLEGVVRLSGATSHDDVVRHMREAAVLVAPCVEAADGDRDGLPTVVLEAMALGTPCITTNVTGLREVIQHNETGFSAPQKNPHALASVIQDAMEDASLRNRMALAARAKIVAEFDVEKNALALRRLFHNGKLASERRRTA